MKPRYIKREKRRDMIINATLSTEAPYDLIFTPLLVTAHTKTAVFHNLRIRFGFKSSKDVIAFLWEKDGNNTL
jgi:hypothetical protein